MLDVTVAAAVVDGSVAARWRSLGELPPNTIGRRVHDFDVSRAGDDPVATTREQGR